MKNIVLIGYMGSGKSSVGRELQKKTNFKLLDSDQEIEKEQGRIISDIFKEDGEAAFRKMEAEYLERLSKNSEKIILSTGGGMPIAEGNAERMKAVGNVIYLKAKAETIYDRLKNDTVRPLLQNGDKMAIITEMLNKRSPFYENAASIVVETDGKNLEQVVEEILSKCQ